MCINKEMYFKELAHAIVETGKSKFCKADWQAKTRGRVAVPKYHFLFKKTKAIWRNCFLWPAGLLSQCWAPLGTSFQKGLQFHLKVTSVRFAEIIQMSLTLGESRSLGAHREKRGCHGSKNSCTSPNYSHYLHSHPREDWIFLECGLSPSV